MILEYNLQFFAKEGMGGEKTEPATEKKLSDARKEGQVAKSREIANGLGLLGPGDPSAPSEPKDCFSSLLGKSPRLGGWTKETGYPWRDLSPVHTRS